MSTELGGRKADIDGENHPAGLAPSDKILPQPLNASGLKTDHNSIERYGIEPGGDLPPEIHMGAWRALNPDEKVPAEHVTLIRNVPYVPARIYGNPPTKLSP